MLLTLAGEEQTFLSVFFAQKCEPRLTCKIYFTSQYLWIVSFDQMQLKVMWFILHEESCLSSSRAAYTYFYKGTNYWRFDNHKTAADKGFPRSILKDFMGCGTAQHPKLDPDTEKEAEDKPLNPSDRGKEEHKEPDGGRDKDKDQEGDENSKPGSPDEEDEKEVNVVVTVADNESKVMTLIMVIVPLVLILCILVLIYGILRTLQNKETPRALVHCKRSLQEWVWRTELQIEPPFIICLVQLLVLKNVAWWTEALIQCFTVYYLTVMGLVLHREKLLLLYVK